MEVTLNTTKFFSNCFLSVTFAFALGQTSAIAQLGSSRWSADLPIVTYAPSYPAIIPLNASFVSFAEDSYEYSGGAYGHAVTSANSVIGQEVIVALEGAMSRKYTWKPPYPGATPFAITGFKSTSAHAWFYGSSASGSCAIHDPYAGSDHAQMPSGFHIFSPEVSVTIPAGGGTVTIVNYHTAALSNSSNDSAETHAYGYFRP